MNIAIKIWYTWVVYLLVLLLVAKIVDLDEHPRLASVLAALAISPIVLGLIAIFVFVTIKIWW